MVYSPTPGARHHGHGEGPKVRAALEPRYQADEFRDCDGETVKPPRDFPRFFRDFWISGVCVKSLGRIATFGAIDWFLDWLIGWWIDYLTWFDWLFDLFDLIWLIIWHDLVWLLLIWFDLIVFACFRFDGSIDWLIDWVIELLSYWVIEWLSKWV